MASANRRETDEKYPNRFKKGQSGNPRGRPKQTKEQQDALEAIRSLAAETPAVLQAILRDEEAPPSQRLKAVELVLERTYGKAEATVKVEESCGDVLAEIRAEVEQIKAASGFD